MIRKNEEKLTKVEGAKSAGGYLRGTILETLTDKERESFGDDDKQLLKFHGIYEQDNRDSRIERRREGLGKEYSFMIRVGLPGGRCDASQYLAIDDLAERYAGHALRLTTRQAFQLHGIVKGDLATTMRSISDSLMTSLAACGDVPRNVMATPAPYVSEPYLAARALASELAVSLRPATGAYHEIWVDGELSVRSDDEEEPFYGRQYLPRKFKLGVTVEGDNSIDVYAYDGGLVGIVQDDEVVGYNVLVGGGFGMTHNKPATIARAASVIGFVTAEQAVEAVRAVIGIHRDYGDRTDRRHARLKYLLEDWGVDRFRTELAERLSFELQPAREMRPLRQEDHLGRHEQGDGRWFVGVWVPNGRVVDGFRGTDARYRSAFRQIAEEVGPTVVLTPMQSVLFADLTASDAERVESILRSHDVPLVESLSRVRRYSMACPALPTCGLALAEAERVQPELIDSLETEFERIGIADTDIVVRMTGCPNGCARPYNADIGLVGRRPGTYHVYVGGGIGGDRLADLFAADVGIEDLTRVLRPLLETYRDRRVDGEGLSDFYRRELAPSSERVLLTGQETPSSSLISLEVIE